MQTNPTPRPTRNKPSSRTQQTVKKKKRSVIPTMLLFMVVLALLVIIFPKEPLSRATTSVGSTNADGSLATSTGPNEAYKGLVISEVMAANSSAVPDETGDYSDWMELWNSSDKPMDISNVGLSDRGDSIRFIFPDIILAADGRIVVFCSDSNQSNPNSALHAKFKISSVGETIYLFDPSAYVIDQITTPVLNSNVSYALQDDGTFAETTDFSPGYPNTTEGHLAYKTANTVEVGVIRINEIMSDPKTGIRDEDGELVDWFELHNTSNQNFSLANIFASDKESDPLKWRFPADAVIPANGYYVVFCSGKDRVMDANSVSHTNFRISAESETIILSDSHGRTLDRVTIDNLAPDNTYGRDAKGEWRVFRLGTPGLPNTQSGMNQMDVMLRSMNTTGVYITEVMASNANTVVFSGADNKDWAELYNSTTERFYLEGYALSDNLNRARKWQFPSGSYIDPGEYKLIMLDGKTEDSLNSQLHTNFKLTRAGGETICFSDPAGNILDKIDLPLIPTDISYGRTAGLNGFFYYDAPTPGLANGTGFYGFAADPAFTTQGGIYFNTVALDINAAAGTQVHYTTDGSIPTEKSPLYEGQAIQINLTTVIRARAFQANLQPSNIITQTYLISVYHDLPIVSLTTDPDVLWNEQTGMLVDGPDIYKEDGPKFKNSIYREFGKTAQAGYLEYYDPSNGQLISQGLEFRLSGDYSLDMPQKSFKLEAKSEYGTKYFTLEEPLFEGYRDFTQFRSLVLRNSGNDNVWTRLLDGLQSRLIDDYLETSVVHQAWKPVVVYLNGVYWGHYNLREAKDRFMIAQHEGLTLEEADNMDILQGNMSTVFGSNKAYKEMIEEIKTLSPGKKEADLKYITDRVDVDNYFDYIAIEMFFGNSDIGNMRMYRLHGDGQKWKWLLFDLDYGLFKSSFNSPYSYTKPKGMGEQNIDNTILLKLLENAEMKEKFLRRLGDIYQTFTTEVMQAKLDELSAIIEPEMTIHFGRWGELNDPYIIAEAPRTAEGALRYWRQRVRRLREETLLCRPWYLWGYIQDAFKLSDTQMNDYYGPRPEKPAMLN